MKFLYPDWPAPAHIKAAVTLIPSGLDLSMHNVKRAEHEQQLCKLLSLPSVPIWLHQIHSNKVIWADQLPLGMAVTTADASTNIANIGSTTNITDNVNMVHTGNGVTNHSNLVMTTADASIANYSNTVCAVLTADCLPILLCDMHGQQIAAIHAGWRGQVAGIIEATINAMTVPSCELLAWLGPAISATAYEVGKEVYDQIMAMSVDLPAKLFFQQHGTGKWLMDLYAIAKFKLQQLGLTEQQIFAGNWCTYSTPDLFHSYRRSKTTQRMASLIWFS